MKKTERVAASWVMYCTLIPGTVFKLDPKLHVDYIKVAFDGIVRPIDSTWGVAVNMHRAELCYIQNGSMVYIPEST